MRLNNLFTVLFAIILFGSMSVFAQTAKVQVIHNSPDYAAEEVDIYLNKTLLLDNFAYKSATPFIDAPAGETITIGIAPSTSKSADESIAYFDYILEADKNYIIVAAGIISQLGSTSANAFDLKVFDRAQLTGSQSDKTDLAVFHGSPDAPAVDVRVLEPTISTAPLVDNLAFGQFAGYISANTADINLAITDESGQTTVAVYSAPLKTLNLNGKSALVLAGGYLQNFGNDKSKDFGLWVVLPDGTSLDLEVFQPENKTAMVQVIHNSPDLLAEKVDIYLDGTLILNDFAYKSATPFVEVPAGQNITISVAPYTSTSVNEAIADFDYTLAEDGKYILIATGLLNENAFNNFEPFTIAVFDMARMTGSNANNTDVLIYHGSTDAPAVDVRLTSTDINSNPPVDDLQYGEFAGYLSLPTSDYLLQLTDQSGLKELFLFDAALKTLGLEGQAITVVATGFVSEQYAAKNRNFTLFVVLPDGNAVELPQTVTSTEDDVFSAAPSTYELAQNYPNPFNPTTTINYSIPEPGNVTLKVFNITGSEVATLVNEQLSAGSYSINFDAANFASGVYFYELRVNNFVQLKKMNLLK